MNTEQNTDKTSPKQPTPLPEGIIKDGENLEKLNALEYVARFFVRLFSRLPLRVLYWLSDFVYLVMYRLIGYRKKVVRGNLTLAFPNKSDEEIKAIEKKFYLHFSDYIFETIKAISINKKELKQRMVFRNPELIQNLLDEGRTVFIYSAHLGNWEWFNVLPNYFTHPVHAFYQGQTNRLTNRITLESRTRDHITAVESKKGFRYTVQCMREGKVFVNLIIGDQCPHFTMHKFWVPFCGVDTPFITGPEHIARKLDCALVYPSYVEYERGRYEIEFKIIAEHPQELPEKECTRRFAALIEEDLQSVPHLWLWSHRRWKLKHEDFPEE